MYFKNPRPEGIPVTPLPPPKSKHKDRRTQSQKRSCYEKENRRNSSGKRMGKNQKIKSKRQNQKNPQRASGF
jgi:hypothetical protein